MEKGSNWILRITCKNELSLGLLKQAVVNLPPLWKDALLKVVPVSILPRVQKAAFCIPEKLKDLDTATKKLKLQNSCTNIRKMANVSHVQEHTFCQFPLWKLETRRLLCSSGFRGWPIWTKHPQGRTISVRPVVPIADRGGKLVNSGEVNSPDVDEINNLWIEWHKPACYYICIKKNVGQSWFMSRAAYSILLLQFCSRAVNIIQISSGIAGGMTEE